MKKTKKGIVAFLLAAALLVSMVGMASAFTITWDLDDKGVMYQESHSETGSVTIGSGSSYVWHAENTAQPTGGVYFPSGYYWGALLEVPVNLTGNCTVYFGYWDGVTFYTTGNSGNTWLFVSIWDRNTLTPSVSSQPFTVPQGDYLAIRVNNTGATDFTVITDGDSESQWSGDTPPYPYPELPTIILMSTGLLALFGYVVYRRRNGKSQ